MLTSILVRPAISDAPYIARSSWDSESYTLSCELEPAVVVADATLASEIDARLGIHPQPRRLVIGDVDVSLDENDRPISIELYTNPREWDTATLPHPLAPPGELHLNMRLLPDAAFRIDTSYRLKWDSQTRTLAVVFSRGVHTWYQIAEGLLFGASSTEEGSLCEIRFEGVTGNFQGLK